MFPGPSRRQFEGRTENVSGKGGQRSLGFSVLLYRGDPKGSRTVGIHRRPLASASSETSPRSGHSQFSCRSPRFFFRRFLFVSHFKESLVVVPKKRKRYSSRDNKSRLRKPATPKSIRDTVLPNRDGVLVLSSSSSSFSPVLILALSVSLGVFEEMISTKQNVKTTKERERENKAIVRDGCCRRDVGFIFASWCENWERVSSVLVRD